MEEKLNTQMEKITPVGASMRLLFRYESYLIVGETGRGKRFTLVLDMRIISVYRCSRHCGSAL